MKKAIITIAAIACFPMFTACNMTQIHEAYQKTKDSYAFVKDCYNSAKEDYVVVRDDIRAAGRQVRDDMRAAGRDVKSSYDEFTSYDSLNDWLDAHPNQVK